VESPSENPAAEVARLRARLNDLAMITAMPSRWASDDRGQIMGTVLDALLGMLTLDVVCFRPNDSGIGDTMHLAASLQGTVGIHDVSRKLDSVLADFPQMWSPHARVGIREIELSLACVPLGHQGDLGVVIAGSRRPDFPTWEEKLVLDSAANQATVGVQQALRHHVIERDSQLLMDSIPGLVALLSPYGEVQFANRQIIDYTGRNLEELKHWGTDDTVHPEDLPQVVQTFTQSIASGSPYEIVQRLRRSDGAYLWFQNNGFPFRDASGNIIRWCVLLTDIDERKRAEEGLGASERNLQLIVGSIPALVWSALPDGTADFFNHYYLDYIGLSVEQARGLGWTTAVHPEDLQGLFTTWQRIMVSEAQGETEARLRRYDGTYRWFLFRVNPLRDESNTIVKWYGVNTDIEDRRRAEAEIRRAYESFAEAQRLSKTGSFITDLVGDDHNWSDETYRIFEFDPATMVTVERIRDIIYPDDVPSFDSMIARAMSGSDVPFAFRIVTVSGAMKHIRGVAHIIERTEGRPMFVGALQDVTESKVAEEDLNRSRSELARVARVTAVSALTASIAHEVNQPLSGIITNASTGLRMLNADPPNVEGARETLKRTIRDGNRASDVITRLRALFSKKEFRFEVLDLNEVTQEVIALSLGELQRSRVVLQVEFATDLPNVTGDRIQLQQVILNLLRNAAEAMGDVHDRPRQLLIETGQDSGDRARLSVRDAGIGLLAQDLNTLFDPFYTTKSGGMGIGLFVSRSIVEQHRGRLWAAPNDGGPGATFAFSLPCDVETALDASQR
jgi:hypothetical protein